MTEAQPTLEARILELAGSPGYTPLKQHELARALRLKDSQRRDFRHLLYKMEREGKLVCKRKNCWSLPVGRRLVAGRLRVHPRGFGFVLPEPPSDQPEIFIPAEALGAGLDGDRVQAQLTPERPSSGRRSPAGDSKMPPPAGRITGTVVRVLERARAQLVGLLKRTRYYDYVIPDNPRILHNVRVRECAPGVTAPPDGHKVVIRLDPWDAPHQALTGVVLEDLGPADQAGLDVLSVMREHRLTAEFPDAVRRAAAAIPPAPPSSNPLLTGRRDLRDALAFTIDPEDARDFDDAVSLTRDPDGAWRLGIHIADVAHFVAPDSPIDLEARARGNTVYLVDRALTMLPPDLTHDVCSLKPREDRLTHSVLARLAPDGRVLDVETTPSVIRSAARLNYDQVQAFFDGDPGDSIPEDVRRTLTAMRELAAIRRAGRMAQGAIDLALPEVRCILDTQGEPIAFRCAGATEAYHLIEEFMLVANTAVARRLHRSRRPALYRVHDAPDETQWKQLRSDLRALDIHARPRTRDDLNAIARAALNSPMQYSIHLAILRNLKRALYTAAPREHFGLAFGLYTHFTSPIRRYPDLIVHRILQALEAGAPTPYTTDELATIAAHCSETEEEADRAEEESVALKRLAWYKHLLAERRPGPFDALVVALQPKGLVLELSDTLQRGLLPFSALTDDYYEINPEHNRAVGRRHKRAWTIGQRLSVCLARVDIARRLVDFYPAPDAEGVRGRDKRK